MGNLSQLLAPAALCALIAAGCAGGTVNEFRDGAIKDGPEADVTVDGAPEPDQGVDAGFDFLLPDGPTPPPPDGPTPPPPDGPTPPPPDGPTPPPDGPTPPPDGPKPDLPPNSPNIGKVCANDTACTGGAQCLLRVSETIGICTVTCTEDDPQTSPNEDSCPDTTTQLCAEIPLASGSSQRYCLQRCEPKATTNDCDTGLSCRPTSTSLTGRLGVAACVFPACSGNDDCPVLTGKSCNASTLTGCTSPEFCVLTGETTAECALPGNCLTQSGLCGKHSQGAPSAKIGDPCQFDTQCGDGMVCLPQGSSGGVVTRRNGYCTIVGCVFSGLSHAACPAGAACSRAYLAGLCLKTCSLTTASDCRGVSADMLGDYECYAWNNFTIGGEQISPVPVCDTPAPCNLLTSAGSTCASLGTSGNPTSMDCRNPATNAVVPSSTPSAVCLDTTASGPMP